MPELPAPRKRRLRAEYELGDHEAHLLTLEPGLAAYFEQVAAGSGNPKAAANFILNDLLRAQNAARRGEDDIPLPADHLAELIRLVDEGTISATAARQRVFPEIYATGRPPLELIRERGLEQVSDETELETLVRAVLDANPEPLARYRAGKTALLGFFVGEVMKASKGKANPSTVNALLREALDGERPGTT